MTQEQWQAIKAATEEREGRIPWLYRDGAVKGNITCGIGHLVPDYDHARTLAFEPQITVEEWGNLLTAPIGMRATAYQIDSKGRLSNAAIDELLENDLQMSLAELKRHFPDWDAYPDGPQAALLDMGFNLGLGGLEKFPHLLLAVCNGDWAEAANQCHRQGISEQRNQETAALFLSGVAKAA